MFRPDLSRLALAPPTGAPEPGPAQQKALSTEDVVANILANIAAADVEEACRMAARWCAVSGNHLAWCDSDDAWRKLTERVFRPMDANVHLLTPEEVAAGTDPESWFFELCERATRLRRAERRRKELVAQDQALLARMRGLVQRRDELREQRDAGEHLRGHLPHTLRGGEMDLNMSAASTVATRLEVLFANKRHRRASWHNMGIDSTATRIQRCNQLIARLKEMLRDQRYMSLDYPAVWHDVFMSNQALEEYLAKDDPALTADLDSWQASMIDAERDVQVVFYEYDPVQRDEAWIQEQGRLRAERMQIGELYPTYDSHFPSLEERVAEACANVRTGATRTTTRRRGMGEQD